MKIKPVVYLFFGVSFVLLGISIAFLPSGWLKQTTLFLGVVAAITGMIIRIAQLTKK
ncbi:MAG TPA: hypothetical protein VFV37_03425 [Luteibaculaceae bacterium]|nr:hypothetical protein [Luteibaculaceae bacterium]